MGYRLHYATTYKVVYGGGEFNHETYAVNSLLNELCPYLWDNNDTDTGYADELEITREDAANAIKTLEEWDSQGKEWKEGCGYKYAHVAEFLKEALEHSDKDNDFIRLSWF